MDREGARSSRREKQKETIARLICRCEKRLWRFLDFSLLERCEGRFLRLENGHGFFEVNDLEDLLYRVAHAADAKDLGAPIRAAEVFDDHCDPAGIDKGNLREVQHERVGGDCGRLFQERAEDTGEMEIDLPSESQNADLLLCIAN